MGSKKYSLVFQKKKYVGREKYRDEKLHRKKRDRCRWLGKITENKKLQRMTNLRG